MSDSITDNINISKTAKDKSDRYLSDKQLEESIKNSEGYVCRRTSPNHENLYDTNKFVMRGRFFGKELDIVFVIKDESITVITQMSQHANTLKGRFYERIGSSVEDAIQYTEELSKDT